MKTELLGQEKNVVRVKVEFEAEEFSKALKGTLRDLSQKVNFPGFRKGHAPRNIIELRFGREAIYNDTLEQLTNDHIHQITEDYELDLIDSPRMKAGEIQEGEPVSCELAFEVMPEVELPDIENMEIEKLRVNVTDELVERAVHDILKRNGEVRDVERPIEAEDVVTVNLTVLVLDDAGGVAETNEPRDETIDLSDISVRAEVRSALLGHSAGDHVETEFKVEEGHSLARYAGKRLRYMMMVVKVAEHVPPELNEEFFKKFFGEGTEIHTEEAFRQWVRDELIKRTDTSFKNEAEQRALAEIMRQAKVDVPQSLVQRQAEVLRDADQREAKERYDADLKDVLGTGDEKWEKNYTAVLMQRARTMVLQSLIVDAIAKKYEVTVETPDIQGEIYRRADLWGLDRNRFLAYYSKDEDALSRLINDVRFSKTTDLLMEKMKVKEVDNLTPVEPQAEPQREEPVPETPGE